MKGEHEMKKEGRITLLMHKEICNGKIYDRFEAVVSTKDADSARRMYEQMGYKVTRV